MKKTIGFTTTFYTLWEVGEPYEEPVMYKGMVVGTTTKQSCQYVQNLSVDLDKAKEKVSTIDGDYNIDLNLRGQSSYIRTLSSKMMDRENYYPHTCFSFGQLEGTEFMTSDNVWQLNRALQQEKSPRRKALARRRLVQLGELVLIKITGIGRIYVNPKEVEESLKQNTTNDLNKKSDFIGTVDEALERKVLFEVCKEIYKTRYGWVYLNQFRDSDGNVIVYKGHPLQGERLYTYACSITGIRIRSQYVNKQKEWEDLRNFGIDDGRYHTYYEASVDSYAQSLGKQITEYQMSGKLVGITANYVRRDKEGALEFFNFSVDREVSKWEFEVGSLVVLKGKVKEHSEYNGVKQTVVERVKLGRV